MLTDQVKERFDEIRKEIRAIPGITPAHAMELERSLDIVLSGLTETREKLDTWTHMTIVVDKDMFETAGYDVSDLTKADLDQLADELNDYWLAGKGYDRAIEYAASGILERSPEEEEQEEPKPVVPGECACCSTPGSFQPDQDGACAVCGHEHTEHWGMEEG